MKKREQWEKVLFGLLVGKKGRLAARELAGQMEKFEGLYEAAWLFVQKKGQDIASPLREWTVRAQRISPDGELGKVLEGLLNHPAKSPVCPVRRLMWVVRSAGIRRERYEGQVLTLSSRQVRAYMALDGHELHVGETIHVLKPAWYLDGRVAEHGLAGEIS